MPCERLNCAQCLTVLALKNDARGVNQFLSNSDKSKPYDPYVVIPSDGLPTLVIEGSLRWKEYGQAKDYRLANSAYPLFAWQQVIMENPIRKNEYDYHISPFYTIIVGCRWLSPHILSSIIRANFIDPVNFHQQITKTFLASDKFREYWSAPMRNAVTMLTSVETSSYQNQ